MKLMFKDMNNFLNISEDIFNCKFNKSLVHQIIMIYASKSRQGTKSQKSRSEVKGSNKKPWRQKGTGRARVGNIRSPLWRSGGITFAAKPKKYDYKVNKKMYKGALRSIFSELIRQNRLILIKKLLVKIPKTKHLINQLNDIFLKKTLIIIEKLEINLVLAARNLYKVKICDVKNINPMNLISFNNVIVTTKSFKKIEEMLQ